MLINAGNRYAIAAGCFGSDGLGKDYPINRPLSDLAGITLKTATAQPRAGNPGKIVHHEPYFTVNAVGLANPGIFRIAADILPRWQGRGCPIGISVWGHNPDEYHFLAAQAASASADYVELNLSCVNADTPALAPAEVAAIAKACSQPLYAKLGLSIASIPPPAIDLKRAIAIAGVKELAGIIIGNSVATPTADYLDVPYGAMSGGWLRPYNQAFLKAVARQSRLPLIGCGGISNPIHIAEYRQAGASGFQAGSALLRQHTHERSSNREPPGLHRRRR